MALVTLVLWLLASLLPTDGSVEPTPQTLPPCPTEDSASCYWDGDTMGNGHGRSYTMDQHGNPTYTD